MLASIRMINCQSWEDLTLELSQDRLNVLIAPNNTGKSVFFKMLKITASPRYFTQEESKFLIRFGADCACFVYSFTDGAIGMTLVYPNRVIYRYAKTAEAGYVSYEFPPRELLDNLGLVANVSEDFVANIIDTDQDMLLVNSNLKGNHALMRLIAENPELAEILIKTDNISREFSKHEAALLERVQILDYRIRSTKFVDVPKLERNLGAASLLNSAIGVLLSVYDQTGVLQQLTRDSIDYGFLIKLADSAVTLEKLQGMLSNVQILPQVDENLETLTDFLVGLEDNLTRIKISTDLDENLVTLVDNLANINTNLRQIKCEDNMNYGCLELGISGCGALRGLRDELNGLQRALVEIENSEKSLLAISEEMRNSGEVLPCAIHGKVVYDGDKCVPYCD